MCVVYVRECKYVGQVEWGGAQSKDAAIGVRAVPTSEW